MRKMQLAVEQLKFRVNPERLDEWIELDYEIWTKGLEKWPGFSSKEIWVSRDNPGEIISVVYWDDYNQWKAIDQGWLDETDRRFVQQFGEQDMQFIEGLHEHNQYFKVTDCRKGEC